MADDLTLNCSFIAAEPTNNMMAASGSNKALTIGLSVAIPVVVAVVVIVTIIVICQRKR